MTLFTTKFSFSNFSFCPNNLYLCFVWIWEQTAIISQCSINWLVFITETECVYCAVGNWSLYTASLTFSNSTFCPHSVFMCFVWIWEQTAIISLCRIYWLDFLIETECVYCAVRTWSLYIIQVTLNPIIINIHTINTWIIIHYDVRMYHHDLLILNFQVQLVT